MSILCWAFGHQPQPQLGYGSDMPYLRVSMFAIDGICRHHARLYARCPRCGEEYVAGKIHIPMDYVRGRDYYPPKYVPGQQ